MKTVKNKQIQMKNTILILSAFAAFAASAALSPDEAAKTLHGRDRIGDDEFRYFPILDYPLVVTDLAVFREFVAKD